MFFKTKSYLCNHIYIYKLIVHELITRTYIHVHVYSKHALLGTIIIITKKTFNKILMYNIHV